MSFEIALGRWVACVRHPHAAWRRLRPKQRAALVGTYTGLGYVATLVVLLALR